MPTALGRPHLQKTLPFSGTDLPLPVAVVPLGTIGMILNALQATPELLLSSVP